jgi:hypothetical protein
MTPFKLSRLFTQWPRRLRERPAVYASWKGKHDPVLGTVYTEIPVTRKMKKERDLTTRGASSIGYFSS